MSKVTPIGGYTRLDISPDNVLEGAKNKLHKVLVIGRCHDDEDYFAASTASKQELLYMLERFKFKLLIGDFED